MVTEQINHDPAQAFMNSGSILKGRPSMGSWLVYGLAAESDSLPGFIVLISQTKGGGIQPVSARQWSSGFLPSRFQGIMLQSKGDAVHYVGNPDGVCQSTQRMVVEEVQRLNGLLAEEPPRPGDRDAHQPVRDGVQDADERPRAHRLHPGVARHARVVRREGAGRRQLRQQLPARPPPRRAAACGSSSSTTAGGDHHNGIEQNMPISAKETDQATAALVTDLKQRGMLDDTLVIWGGEFGRTPMGQDTGRDHHINAFSLWMAGGGVKPGMTFGATDELGYRSVEDVVSMHDLHATMLHLCGIDHERFTVKFQGLDAKLSGVSPAKIVKQILA